MIKPLKKRVKVKSKSYYRNKADKIIQELGREMYKKCLVCDNKQTVMHHYYPKSSAGNLRYHWENLIPLCQGCHFRLHNSDPRIQNAINKTKGQDWLDDLNEAKKQFIKCDTVSYYKDIINKLKK